MKLLEMDLDEESMTAMIKDLLSLIDGGHWLHRTTDDLLKIGFKGNSLKVMKDISDWLNIPERKQYIETLGDSD